MSLVAPVATLYCGQCGMPPEFCQYGPDFKTHCQPWLQKTHPELATKLHSLPSSSSSQAKKISPPPTATEETSPTETTTPRITRTPVLVDATNPWTTKERLFHFYKKYVPDKMATVDDLLVKYSGKEENLFTALTKKYGPEPLDPYLAAKYGISADDKDDNDDSSDDEDSSDDAPVKKLSGMKLAQTAAASKVAGADEEDENSGGEGEGAEKTDADAGDEKRNKKRGVAVKATKKIETRIVIQKVSRQRKKAVTIVIGMDTVEGLKLKDVAKDFAKRFAGASSVKDSEGGSGSKEIIIQGDHMDDVADMINKKYKVKRENIFLDIDGQFVTA